MEKVMDVPMCHLINQLEKKLGPNPDQKKIITDTKLKMECN